MNWKLYVEASKVLKRLENKQGSLKSLIFTQPHVPNGRKKKIYAVVAQTLECELNELSVAGLSGTSQCIIFTHTGVK